MIVRFLVGDCIAHLKTLPDESVDCVVTSPPYWGLRDYGIAPTIWGGDAECEHVFGDISDSGCYCYCGAWRGVLGLEPTLQQHIDNLVLVFREVRRVLKKTGVCWVNYGDAYAGSWGAQSREPVGKDGPNPSKISANQIKAAQRRTQTGSAKRTPGLKPKDRMGLPHRLVFALQADGWWWRDEIIWAKPNPMPSSVRDRTTPAHEMVFLLTKAPKYFYDQESIRTSGTKSRIIEGARKKLKVPGGWDKGDGAHGTIHRNGRTEALYVETQTKLGANRRSVWTVAPKPFKEAHFATFPPALIEPMILAGCPEKVCAACGAPWVRVVEKTGGTIGKAWHNHNADLSRGQRGGDKVAAGWKTYKVETLGFKSTCGCDLGTVPGVVLDPFGGAGTTALVARDNGRDAILIELNPEYVEIAKRRLAGEPAKPVRDKQQLGRQAAGFNKRWSEREEREALGDLW